MLLRFFVEEKNFFKILSISGWGARIEPRNGGTKTAALPLTAPKTFIFL